MKWTKLNKTNPPRKNLIIMKWKDKKDIQGLLVDVEMKLQGIYTDDFFYPSLINFDYNHVSFLVEMDAEWMYAD